MQYKLEVIGFTIDGCLVAQSSGAHRIELCDNPGDGGTTPSLGFIQSARKKLNIELYPIIRPRGGDFFYSKEEFEIMKTDVRLCREAGCDGIVAGILNADGSIDTTRCLQLAEIAYPLGVTFHRAFDRTNDPFKAMDDLIDCGFERILTSGQRPTAGEGIELITTLVAKAEGRIVIMPGSGIRSDNIAEIAMKTRATEFHTSARTSTGSNMQFVNENMKEQLKSVSVNKDEILQIRKILDGL